MLLLVLLNLRQSSWLLIDGESDRESYWKNTTGLKILTFSFGLK